MVTPRRLSFGLLMVYLLYMLAMYMRDIKEEEKEQVAMEVEAVVRNIALNATANDKDTNVLLLQNGESKSSAVTKEVKTGEDEGGGEGGEGGVGGGGGGGRAEEEIIKERKVKRLEIAPSVDSWLRNKTEFRLWIGEANNHDTALLSLILDDNKKQKTEYFQIFRMASLQSVFAYKVPNQSIYFEHLNIFSEKIRTLSLSSRYL